MQSPTNSPASAPGTSADPRAFWRALLYRWFVEYNPAYLLSAAFVFGGCFLWSRGVVNDASLASTLGIPAVAELYAVALVGGAALLTRLGQRRPAVILSLVFVAYQWDTTFHTEACAYLRAVGVVAAAVWLVLFAAKLAAIAWALRIRIGGRMQVAFALAAAGLVLLPRAIPAIDARATGSLLAAWIFALVSLYRGGEIASRVELDDWGSIVLRRATHGAWTISAAMLLLHVHMWCDNFDVSLAPLFFTMPLLAVRHVRSEARTFALIATMLVLAALLAPGAFFATSIVAAGALLLRIYAPRFGTVTTVRRGPPERVAVPYRVGGAPVYEARSTIERTPAPPLAAGEIARAWAGSIFGIYLGVWTARWSHGAFPAHVVWVDALLAVAVVIAMWRSRAHVTFAAPLAANALHFVASAHLVPTPRSSTGWGELGIAIGFALLGVSLLVSYRLRGFEPTKRPVDTV